MPEIRRTNRDLGAAWKALQPFFKLPAVQKREAGKKRGWPFALSRPQIHRLLRENRGGQRIHPLCENYYVRWVSHVLSGLLRPPKPGAAGVQMAPGRPPPPKLPVQRITNHHHGRFQPQPQQLDCLGYLPTIWPEGDR